MLSVERLAEIKARCKAATPGPWLSDSCVDEAWVESRFENSSIAQLPENGAARPFKSRVQDAAFIANARDDVPELVAEVERLCKEVENYDKLLVSCRTLDAFVKQVENPLEKRIAALELLAERAADYAAEQNERGQ